MNGKQSPKQIALTLVPANTNVQFANKKKLKLSAGMVKGLTWFRKLLWFVLMALMVAGLWFDWINYEFFTAFIFQAASVVVIVLAVVCTLTSIFVPRPYCRFVCPTGTLMKMAEG